jgi:hypothetical protein
MSTMDAQSKLFALAIQDNKTLRLHGNKATVCDTHLQHISTIHCLKKSWAGGNVHVVGHSEKVLQFVFLNHPYPDNR